MGNSGKGGRILMNKNIRVSTEKNEYADIRYRHRPFWNHRKLLALLVELRSQETAKASA